MKINLYFLCIVIMHGGERFKYIITKLPYDLLFEIYINMDSKYIPNEMFKDAYFHKKWRIRYNNIHYRDQNIIYI